MCALPSILAALACAGATQSPTVPDAIVDLRTAEGIVAVQGSWRFLEPCLVEVDHRFPGPDLKATGAPNRTHDLEPRIGTAEFDAGPWTVVEPTDLERRRTNGRLSFGWYRLGVTIPQSIGTTPCDGASIWFEIVADDYSEIWVNGAQPIALGQSGAGAIAGWNAPNRVLLTSAASPGESFDIAVLCANGPLGHAPPNYVWIRSATLDVLAASRAVPQTVPFSVTRLDPRIDAVVPPDAKLERLAEGFGFAEGPVWDAATQSLLFSDPNQNVIHRLSADGRVSIARTKSGYSGPDIGRYRQPGSNGLAMDRDGRVTICEHGNRRVTRLEANGTLTVLADRFEGKRLNSPNDLVYRSDGALFFTDPYFGLPGLDKDPRKELPHQGVYCLHDGTLRLLTTELDGPNGIALSPDESKLYVANWDVRRKVVMRHDLAPDGSVSGGIVFADLTSRPGEEALDGLEVDELGNVYVSGPGGISIFAADGVHLGTIVCPELPANMAWGGNSRDASGDDGSSLYLAARTSIYRLRLKVRGAQATPREAVTSAS